MRCQPSCGGGELVECGVNAPCLIVDRVAQLVKVSACQFGELPILDDEARYSRVRLVSSPPVP